MFICKRCETQKEIGEFYRHPKAASGYDSTCKQCRRNMVRANRSGKADYYRAYDRERYKKDPRVKSRIKRYAKTEAGKQAAQRAKEKYINKNPEKRAAHVILGNAVRDGKIKKPGVCEMCGGSGRIHGHHDDYTKPLAVRWLCPGCHTKWHKENDL